MIGFKMDEIMTGTHTFKNNKGPKGEHSLHFSLTWGNNSILKFLNPFSKDFLSSEARGVITVEGLTEKATCFGTLQMLYFTEQKIRYILYFRDEKGRRYKYKGEKINLRPWNLHKTHVTCYGVITDLESGERISDSVVYFPYRESIPFVLSFRLRIGKIFKFTETAENLSGRSV